MPSNVPQVFFVGILLLSVTTILVTYAVGHRTYASVTGSDSELEAFFNNPAAWPTEWNLTHRDYTAPELAFPTKCVDCERQFPAGQRWRGQQTSCFSCEPLHANKCFDCESA